MSEKTYGVGIVGFGFMGKTHSYGYRTIPLFYGEPPVSYRLRGVCETQPEALAFAKAHLGFEFGVTDYRELVARDDIDIVHVCTPNVYHKPVILDAIRAGKHVYCDKPLAASHKECREIVQALEEHGSGLVTQVALQFRFVACVMRAKQLIEEGFLGRVFSFRAGFLHSSSINPKKPLTWKLDKKMGGGGVLFDLGSHVLDLLVYLLGPLERVFADCETFFRQRPHAETGEMVDVDADDLSLVLARTRSGALGMIEASKMATGTNSDLKVEIHGEKGAIRFNLMDPNWLEVYDVRDPAEPIGGMRGFRKVETCGRYPSPGGRFPTGAFNIGFLRSHVACLHHFLSAVAGKATAHPTFREAADLQRLMEVSYASAAEGQWKHVDG
jgi:predicted dehydrogenase